MATDLGKKRKMKAFIVISGLYLPFLLLLSGISGHLHYLGDPSLFFASWTDAPEYKLIADYYVSLGNSEYPSDYLLTLRPYMFPLYLGLYQLIGIAGMQVLQMMMNAASLWLVFVSIKALSNRSWIAGLSAALLAVTPSFNFLVFHALTETISIFLICVFTALIVDHFKNCRQTSLFLATLVVSILLCIRPIMLPFWIVFVAYYLVWWLRERKRRVWQPIISITPILCQLILSLAITGSATLPSSGSVTFSTWFFPVVYGEKEYGRFVGRQSKEAEEGMRRFPELKDKVLYLINNYKETGYAYYYLLIGDNLTAGSNFVHPPGQSDDRHKTVPGYLLKWSIYLNRIFACLHAIMLALMIGLVVTGKKLYGQKAMWVCYIFAVLLILPSGIGYWQGDRYITVAEPLLLIGHSALVGLFLDLLKNYSEAGSQDRGLLHVFARTKVR